MAKKDGDDDLDKDTIGRIAEILRETPVYEDALQPAAKSLGAALEPAGQNIGEAITTVTEAVKLVLAPVAGLVWGYKQVEEIVFPALAERFKNKLHKLVSPQLTVAGPAIEALKFAGPEPFLRDMYINLLATSMDKDTTKNGHPSFVEIIRQMTPDEARLLNHIASSKSFVFNTIL